MFDAQPVNEALTSGTWFTVLPDNMHAEQKQFLAQATSVTLASGGPASCEIATGIRPAIR